MLHRRKGYLYALTAILSVIGGWNLLGLINENFSPADYLPLHNFGLAAAIILAVLYCGDREADIATILKYGIKLGEKLGAERERSNPPTQRESFEVVARFPFQKNKAG